MIDWWCEPGRIAGPLGAADIVAPSVPTEQHGLFLRLGWVTELGVAREFPAFLLPRKTCRPSWACAVRPRGEGCALPRAESCCQGVWAPQPVLDSCSWAIVQTRGQELVWSKCASLGASRRCLLAAEGRGSILPVRRPAATLRAPDWALRRPEATSPLSKPSRDVPGGGGMNREQDPGGLLFWLRTAVRKHFH